VKTPFVIDHNVLGVYADIDAALNVVCYDGTHSASEGHTRSPFAWGLKKGQGNVEEYFPYDKPNCGLRYFPEALHLLRCFPHLQKNAK
jgi:hypothetical protein